MQVVTPEELADALNRITGAFEAGLAKIATQACGKQQEYFTRAEAAEYLRISHASLDRLAATGEIRRAKLGVGAKTTVLYRKCDLDIFVESRLESDKNGARHIARQIKLSP